MNTAKTLFCLLRGELTGSAVTCETPDLQALYTLANAHDLAHLAASALSRLGRLQTDDISAKFKQSARAAVWRHELRHRELQSLCRTLEAAGIPFLPLKGAVLCDYYQEPWMRTSSDLDILVHKEHLEAAAACLCERLHYDRQMETNHDISFFSPSGVHLELHFDLADDCPPTAVPVLSNIWNMVTVKSGWSCFFEMPDELFYFYHISHMAKHVLSGGCGIKPFLDLWILDHKSADEQARDGMLRSGELLQFAQVARRLSRVWLEEETPDSATQKLESYILRGGVYGNTENRIAVQQQKRGGKLGYILSKIILPYNSMKLRYPILFKYPWLTPAMQICRWCTAIFRGPKEQTIREMRYNQKLSGEQANEMKQFLEEMGL